MKRYHSLLLLAIAVACAESIAAERRLLPQGLEPLSQELIDAVNGLKTTWQAGPTFANARPEFLGSLFGVKEQDFKLPIKKQAIVVELPSSFDARDKWPECPSLREVRDQSNCGSCWAFATVEAITDRTCIASGGNFTDDISAEDLLTCCTSCGMGCRGGWPPSAWKYWVEEGLVTGGLFNGTGCQPYSIPPHHHGESYRETPECKRNCADPKLQYQKEKHFGKKAYTFNTTAAIRADILQHGSVGAAITVYSDFLSYKSGVYQRHSLEFLGGHAVKLIGWGETDDGTPYWIGVNSWNTEWGENGFFKFLRGTNECGIEASVMGGLPDLERTSSD